jgi:anti-sigma factor RsiW
LDCKEGISSIHDYLDDEIQGEALLRLKGHLQVCPKCNLRLRQLEKADAFFRILSRPCVPEGLTERVVQSVAPHKKRTSWFRWVKLHPAVSIALVFLFLIISSVMSLWNQETDLMLKGKDLEHIVIEGDKVTVPEGRTVQGNLIVENGRIQVDGHITGNLVVIDGAIMSGSYANVTGNITSVDRVLDWVRYKVKALYSLITQ